VLAAPLVRLGLLAVVPGTFVALLALSGSLSPEAVQDRVDGAGAWGPLLFFSAGVLLTAMLFPSPFLAAASGLLFGTAAGTPITMVTMVCGAALAFSISRWWGHAAVEELAGDAGRLATLRAWVGRRGFVSVLYARLAPGVPYTLVSYAAGLAPIGLGAFVVATAVGVAPRAFAYTALGGTLGDLGRPESRVAVATLVLLAILGLVLARREGRPA
jgi:uncharacterized membrane protein YdjX (TVP38/TMEM64 family)